MNLSQIRTNLNHHVGRHPRFVHLLFEASTGVSLGSNTYGSNIPYGLSCLILVLLNTDLLRRIRLMIWELNAPGPRIIAIKLVPREVPSKQGESDYQYKMIADIPANLHASTSIQR